MSATPTKLDRLIIGEVSGVDDPANELPGWMVAKAAGQSSLGVGPDAPWDVAEAERRIREATGASDAPTAKYASCYLWPGNGAVPEKFADYKFLVCDVVDGRVSIMPRALKAVGDRLPHSTLSDDAKDAVTAKLEKLRERVESATEVQAAEEATSIVGKIMDLLRGKDEVDMTKDELNAALDERFGSFADKLAETLSKSTGAPATDVAPVVPEATPPAPVPTPDAAPVAALTADDVAKAIEAALQPVLEICDKTLDRVAEIEGRFAKRSSLDGQEGAAGDGAAQKPTFGDTLAKAMKSGQTLESAGD